MLHDYMELILKQLLKKPTENSSNDSTYLEKETLKKGISLHDMSLDEMNVIWEEAKKED